MNHKSQKYSLAFILLAVALFFSVTKTIARDYSPQFQGIIDSLERMGETQKRLQEINELQEVFFRKYNNGLALIKKGDRIGGCRDLRIAAELNQSIYSRRYTLLSSNSTAKAEELKASYYVYQNEFQDLIASVINKYC